MAVQRRLRVRTTAFLVVALLATVVTSAWANPTSPPSDLWRPPAGATPTGGTYLYVEGADGRTIGDDNTLLFTPDHAAIELSHHSGVVRVNVHEFTTWHATFSGPDDQTSLARGYYGDLKRYTNHDPALGGLDWGGDGHGCTHHGWFVVDDIAFDAAGELTLLSLRFQEYCYHSDSPVSGELRFERGTHIGEPQNPRAEPAGTWRPAADSTPTTETYVYLESSVGDGIGDGRTLAYTPDSTFLHFTHAKPENGQPWLWVQVDGSEDWLGHFGAPAQLPAVAPGYYGDLQSNRNPMYGSLNWSGESIDNYCQNGYGWYVVDDIAFEDGELVRLALRFEQRCDDPGAAPLQGEVRFVDGTQLGPSPNPQPVPSQTWRPAPGAAPTSDTYVYLESTEGDYIGYGDTLRYTPDTAAISVTMPEPSVIHVAVDDGDVTWTGDFSAPIGIDRPLLGYYADLQRYPFHEIKYGGLAWSGRGGSCGTLHGWFVVDEVTYDASGVHSLSLRFQQRCDSVDTPPLHGEIRWQSPEPADNDPQRDVDYTDVSGHQHASGIDALADHGIAGGHPDGAFRPNAGTTRGQMATYLTRALRLPAADTTEGGPGDIAGHTHERSIRAVIAAGIALGYDDGTFRPNAPVPRDQMASFLARALDLPSSSGENPFSDIAGNVHRDSILAAAEADIATGYPDGRYRPHSVVTRGQMASFIARALHLI